MRNELLVKASGAVAIENLITVNQRKIYNSLLAKATPQFQYGVRTFAINVQELKGAVGDASYTTTDIQRDLEALITTLVKFNILRKDRRDWGGATAALSGYSIDYETGEITYNWDDRMLVLLVVQSGSDVAPYTKINIGEAKILNSKHEYALFELFTDYYNPRFHQSETRWIKVEEFQTLMGTNYARWGDLKKWVIDNPILELRALGKLDFDVKYETKKGYRGRVIEIKFIFTKKNKKASKVQKQTEKVIDFEAVFTALPSAEQERILVLAREKCAYFLKMADEEPEKFRAKAEAAVIYERNEILKTL